MRPAQSQAMRRRWADPQWAARQVELMKRGQEARRSAPPPAPPSKEPFTAVEARMREIAASVGLGLHHLRGKLRTMEAVKARTQCYALLWARGWGYSRIGRYFNKTRQTVRFALDPEFKAKELRAAHARYARRKQRMMGKAA